MHVGTSGSSDMKGMLIFISVSHSAVTQHFGSLTFWDDAKAKHSYLSHNLPTTLVLPFLHCPSVIPFLSGNRGCEKTGVQLKGS